MNSTSIEETLALLRGQCLCGAVRYQVEDAFRYAFNCHCSQCRRATGAAFKPFAGIERARLRLEQGQGDVMVYGNTDAAHDVHCGCCGSLLYSVVREGAYVHVTLGTLVDAPTIRPQGHLFVGSKAPWHEITDALPQYDEFPS
ncbi:GFA family protein [Paraburkholderia bannensis]|uniref:GFA family protein n=1 Tax=Paraburkholderia bannensis TaxID=765414 RepID=UPI002AB791EA|nr:GFA family protein [Paraburkholderia bannensis]